MLLQRPIFCLISGRPQPDVSWYMNGNLVDEEYEQSSGNIIENRLLWPSLQRHDLYSVFTCRAANTKAVAPRERRLVLDMYRTYFFPITIPSLVAVFHFDACGDNQCGNNKFNRFLCFACIPAYLMTYIIIIILLLFFFLSCCPLPP